MKMERLGARLSKVLVIAAVLVSARGSQSQEEPKKTEGVQSPDDVLTGEIRITMNSDYARLRVDGNEWEEHEFLDNGKTIVIHTVRRTEEHKVTLSPIYPDLPPVELTIAPADWKLAAVSKTEKVWRVERKVEFAKAAKAPPKGK
jgi:hypothetical protein